MRPAISWTLVTLQVTFDEHSLLINGKRIMFYSGEVHPFRLPVPGLYLDILQKIRAMGYTGVSFYVDWALLEGKPGNFSAKGVFDLQPFFDAASAAGIYLLAVSPLLLVGATDQSAAWPVHQRRGLWRRLPWLDAASPGKASHG
jgi:beta-galactosidase GanA